MNIFPLGQRLGKPQETENQEMMQQRPGIQGEAEINGALLRGGNIHIITDEDVKRGAEILQKYKAGKANLEARVVEDEEWYKLRHWEYMRKQRPKDHIAPEPASAWLFNAIANKHADAQDNYPEPVVLPREKSDEQSAKVLTQVLPVIMEQNDFGQTYSDNWWEKLKHGTAAYGVFWNNSLENGLGDIDIKAVDLLKIFWEPGITDIQKSRNLFIVDLVDKDLIIEEYPQLDGKINGSGNIDIKQYLHDDSLDTTDKAVVVDWYYKRRNAGGMTVLHYIKFCADTLLYASENDDMYRDSGFYNHGMYPVIFDNLFPEKGTPVGFGYVAICKDPQMYIDKLSANILETSMMGTKVRYFALGNTGINEEEFLDWNRPIVHVEGNSLEDTRLRKIEVGGIDGIYFNVLQWKVEEMKDTAGNRDVNSGGTGGGVTAASAIAALQEAGNKTSRDMISAAYRSYVEICKLCIELIRQFYDESRSFRITGEMSGQYDFINLNNKGLKEQPITDSMRQQLFRKPVFDLKIQAQKKNPFSQMAQNETAKELYKLGFFLPDKAQEASAALEMMNFEGIDKIREKVNEGQTLLNLCQQMKQQISQYAAKLAQVTGSSPATLQSSFKPLAANDIAADEKGEGTPLARSMSEAQTPKASYSWRLAQRTVK